jgi:hypothetical protein
MSCQGSSKGQAIAHAMPHGPKQRSHNLAKSMERVFLSSRARSRDNVWQRHQQLFLAPRDFQDQAVQSFTANVEQCSLAELLAQSKPPDYRGVICRSGAKLDMSAGSAVEPTSGERRSYVAIVRSHFAPVSLSGTTAENTEIALAMAEVGAECITSGI